MFRGQCDQFAGVFQNWQFDLPFAAQSSLTFGLCFSVYPCSHFPQFFQNCQLAISTVTVVLQAYFSLSQKKSPRFRFSITQTNRTKFWKLLASAGKS